MSVLSRNRGTHAPSTSDTGHRSGQIALPTQRAGTAPLPQASPSGSRRARVAVLATSVALLGAAGAGTWALVDDGSSPAPAPTTVQISGTEAERDAAQARRNDRLGDRLDREAQRDAARAGVFTP